MPRRSLLGCLMLAGSWSVAWPQNVPAPLAYQFDFAPSAIFGAASFSYVANTPTPPGTSLSNVQSSVGSIFPLLASRDATGAWSFTATNSPTFSVTFAAETDLQFPNSPGVYKGEPSRITVNAMFMTTMAAGAVDITITSLPPPAISSGGVVTASSFGEFPAVAPGSWVEIYGTNLAPGTRTWEVTDFDGILAPKSLDGASVTIGGQPAYVAYISPNQVNVQAPSGLPPGVQPLVLMTSAGATSAYDVTVNPLQPGLDAPPTFIFNGVQYVVALLPDGTLVLPAGAIPGVNSRPAQPGDIITLYGVGFGEVIPAIPAGQIVQQLNTLASPFSLLIGGTPADFATLNWDLLIL